jgi:hypothetical protein
LFLQGAAKESIRDIPGGLNGLCWFYRGGLGRRNGPSDAGRRRSARHRGVGGSSTAAREGLGGVLTLELWNYQHTSFTTSSRQPYGSRDLRESFQHPQPARPGA